MFSAPFRPAAADIFEFIDEHGTAHYSNVPADDRYERLIGGARQVEAEVLDARDPVKRTEVFVPMIATAASAAGLEPALVRAVMVAESGGQANAVSKRGAQGLMQLMPATARQYGADDAFDPQQNIDAGAKYLRDLLVRYQNRLELVLAAYNAGPTAVEARGGTIPPIQETLDYVPRVLRIYHRLLAAGGAH